MRPLLAVLATALILAGCGLYSVLAFEVALHDPAMIFDDPDHLRARTVGPGEDVDDHTRAELDGALESTERSAIHERTIEGIRRLPGVRNAGRGLALPANR